MGKKILVACAIGIMAFAAFPAGAGPLVKKNVTFSADPCAAVCPYWFDARHLPNEQTDPTTYDPTTLEHAVLTDDSAWCADGITGHVDEIKVKAPKRAELLIFEAWPEVDWDIALCRKTRKGLKFVTYGANTTTDVGTSEDLCSVGIACYEKLVSSVKGGKRYVLRAFNWSDPADLPARYRFFK